MIYESFLSNNQKAIPIVEDSIDKFLESEIDNFNNFTNSYITVTESGLISLTEANIKQYLQLFIAKIREIIRKIKEKIKDIFFNVKNKAIDKLVDAEAEKLAKICDTEEAKAKLAKGITVELYDFREFVNKKNPFDTLFDVGTDYIINGSKEAANKSLQYLARIRQSVILTSKGTVDIDPENFFTKKKVKLDNNNSPEKVFANFTAANLINMSELEKIKNIVEGLEKNLSKLDKSDTSGSRR